ncbi:MAG: WXG100 family type VII secretion target [Ruminococcus sp.]
MDGTLKVTPEKLIAAASEFSAQGNTVSSLTQQMMTIVQGLSSVWQGEASSAYLARFQQLQGDIDQMNKMIQEHVQDLNDMARNYQSAEDAGKDIAAGLASDVIL